MTNYRIMAAEFVGWRSTGHPDGFVLWAAPPVTYPDSYVFTPDEIPNPEHNDTDCMALVDAISKLGYSVTIGWNRTGTSVLMHRPYVDDAVPTRCDDYKQGVKELAEPILRKWYTACCEALESDK